MKALTLTQPWASLVALGAKQIETRSWATGHRGPVAIHAGQGLGPVGGRDGLVELVDEEPFHLALEPYWSPGKAWDCYALVDALPRGAIVAVAELAMCHRTHLLPWREGRFEVKNLQTRQTEVWNLTDQERAFGDYSHGRYAWLLQNVRPLRTPVPCRGALSLWSVPADVLAAVEAQLNENDKEHARA